LKKEWCIPPKANAAFVSQMEDVLDVYAQPYDAQHPLVCMDETSKQLLGDVREPLPLEPGQPVRFDSEYERHGVNNLFLAFAPLSAWRHVTVTHRRTRLDWAEFVRIDLQGQCIAQNSRLSKHYSDALPLPRLCRIAIQF